MGHRMNHHMQSLYQDALKRHYKEPLGQKALANPSHQFEGYNASCGDEILFSLQTSNANSMIHEIAFEGDSCAICTASASILCEVTNKQSSHIFNQLHLWLENALRESSNRDETTMKPNTDSIGNPQQSTTHWTQKLDALAPLLTVSQFPSRINCALLPWQTFAKALNAPLEPSLSGTLNHTECG
jgi:nitrogen fixation NifU-like protein